MQTASLNVNCKSFVDPNHAIGLFKSCIGSIKFLKLFWHSS